MNELKQLLTDDYWYLVYFVGLLILLAFIIKDYKLSKKYLITQNQHVIDDMEKKSVQQVDIEEGVVLIDPQYKLIGGNRFFYLLTGLKELKPHKQSIQFLSSIFSPESRQQHEKQLLQIIEQGSGSMKAEIYHVNGQYQEMTISIYEIYDDKEVIIYYLAINEYEQNNVSTSKEE